MTEQDAAPRARTTSRWRRVPRLRPSVAWALALAPLAWLLLRLSGAGRGTRIEVLLAFTPWVAAASLLALAGTILLRHRRATITAAVTCLGFAVAMGPVFVGGPNAPVNDGGTRLRIMTVNAKYGEADPDRLIRLVVDHDIDILGIQELTDPLVEALRERGLDDLLVHQVLRPADHAAGMGLYATSPFERVDLGLTAELEQLTGRFTFAPDHTVEVTVVHPLPPLGSWRQDWREVLEQLAALDVGGPDDPTRLIIGDFNATLDQPTLRSLLAVGYHDAASAVGQGWVPTWGPGSIPLLAIDHILVERTVHVEAVSIHDVEGSDHRAVIAIVHLPTAP